MTTMARSGQAAPAGAGRLERGVRPHSVRSRQRAEGAMCKRPASMPSEAPQPKTSGARLMRCSTSCSGAAPEPRARNPSLRVAAPGAAGGGEPLAARSGAKAVGTGRRARRP
jgi:hypothetical protein